MSTWGYDLDGVLLPDIDYRKYNDHQSHCDTLRNLKPLFIPRGPYVIITGRGKETGPITLSWALEYLKDNPPCVVYCSNPDFRKAAQYKISVINRIGVSVYVESDPEMAKLIKQGCPKTKVVCFKQVVQKGLSCIK